MPSPQTVSPQTASAQSKNTGTGGGPLATIVSPFTRAGSYYARSWGAFLGAANGSRNADLPVARPTLSLATHALRDELVLLGLLWRRPLSDPQAYERINAEIIEAVGCYRDRGWLDDPQDYFTAPPAPEGVWIRSYTKGNRTHQRLSFDSGYTPHPGEPGAQRWMSYTGNHREYALVLRHREPRPWLVCVHGTEMGRAGLDLTLFRAWHLHEDLGLNVALPVLPMHGPRARRP